MIKVTRLNGKTFYINNDLIEFLEETPDTIITTTTGKKIVVAESVQEIIDLINKNKGKIEYIKQKNLESLE